MPLSYTVKEGLAGFRRAKFATAASTTAMVVALVLIGIFVLLGYYGQVVSTHLKQWVGELEIFLDQVDESVAHGIRDRAAAYPGVVEARYISREEAEQIFLADFGDGAETYLGENFLPASIRVKVESGYANPDSLEVMSAEFASWARVDEVVFNQPLLVRVQQNVRLFAIFGLSLGLLVVGAALFMVANTVRLTIYARRLLIRTMKLVGATDRFIRQPFLVEGLVQGVLAGLISALAIWSIVEVATVYIPQLADEGWPGGVPYFFLTGVFFAGILLGWIGSLLAVRRFIQKVELH